MININLMLNILWKSRPSGREGKRTKFLNPLDSSSCSLYIYLYENNYPYSEKQIETEFDRT